MGVYSAIIAAVMVSLVLTVLFAMAGSRGPWGSTWTFFLVLFLALWAIGLFLNPVGPLYWNISWIPIIFAGILLALLLLAATPPTGASGTGTAGTGVSGTEADKHPREETEMTGAAIGAVFWLLISLLVVAIIIGVIVD